MAKNLLKITQAEFSKEISKRYAELFQSSRFKNDNELRIFLENDPSSATFSDLRSGNHNISAFKLMRIMVALDASADYIFFGEEKKPLLSDFQSLLDKVANQQDTIGDKEIRDIVLALTDKKISNMGLFASIKKLAKLDKNIDKDKINALNVIIDSILE